MESSYFDTDCFTLVAPRNRLAEDITVLPRTTTDMKKNDAPKLIRIPNDTYTGQTDTRSSFNFEIDRLIDWRPGLHSTLWDHGMSSFIPNVTDEKTFFEKNRSFLFESKLFVFVEVKNATTVAYCNIRRVYVGSAVHCVGNPSSINKPQCSLTAGRDSRKQHPPPDVTSFPFPAVLNKFTSALATSQG